MILDDIKGWDNYKDFVNKLGKMSDEEKRKRREARKKFWEYMKHILFGDPKKQDTQGLIDARNLNDDDLENIANCLSKKFEFFTGITLLCDKEDVFDKNKDKSNGKFKYENYILDSLKEFKDLFLPRMNSKLEPKINRYLLECLDKSKQKQEIEITKLNGNGFVTSWKRLTAGIILLVFGVIGCVITALGLASKLAVALLFLFVFMIVTGTLCLLWGKISDCLAPCCPQIFDSRYQKSLIDKSKIIKQEINFNLTTNNILQK